MFTTAGPQPGRRDPAGAPDAGPAGLAIRRVVRRRFETAAAFGTSPGHQDQLRTYLADLARPYGLAVRAEPFAHAEGQSYGEMGATLLAEAVPVAEPVDLLVLAFAVPDIRPGRATALYLGEICPGRPFAFAVSDQGTAAAFTALRLVAAYVRGGECRRAVLLVVEQATQAQVSALAAPVPAGHAGVALVLEPQPGEDPGPAGGPGRPDPAGGLGRIGGVRQCPGVAPAQVPGMLTAELARDPRPAGPAVLLAGSGLAAAVAADQLPGLDPADRIPGVATVRAAGAGQPYTGVWWELAGALTGPATPAAPASTPAAPASTPAAPASTPAGRPRLLVADYDPMLGYLCLATATPEGAPGVHRQADQP